MKQPKFIITSTGHFRLGMVTWHKDLLQGDEDCWGGGYYEMDYVYNRLILTGESYDFGRPRWEWLQGLKVPATYRNLRMVYVPRNTAEADFVVSEEIDIEYIE